MKALLVTNDPTVFDEQSVARARMRTYAGQIGTLYVLSYAHPAQRKAYLGGVQEGSLVLVAVGGGKIGRLLALKKKARALIQQEHIEVVSAQDPFEYGWVAWQAVKWTQAKLHLQVHTDFCSPWFTRSGVMRAQAVRMPFLNTVRRVIADRVLPHADGVRAVSLRVKSSLVERYGSRIPEPSVIPITTDGTLPSPVALPPHPFSFTLVMVGRLEPEKRIDDALDALARVALTYPTVGLCIIGDGRERARLMRRARRLGLTDRVLFLGWRTDARALMQSAQAYIHTSAYEGYGLVLIEAALARLPIITTDVGIVGEVFTGYEDVLVAPVADPAALAVHIAGLVEDVQSRKALAMSAERKAQTHLATLIDQPVQIAADLARAVTNTPA